MINKFMVGMQGDDIVLMNIQAGQKMSKEDALDLAATLVVMASNQESEDFMKDFSERVEKSMQ